MKSQSHEGAEAMGTGIPSSAVAEARVCRFSCVTPTACGSPKAPLVLIIQRLGEEGSPMVKRFDDQFRDFFSELG